MPVSSEHLLPVLHAGALRTAPAYRAAAALRATPQLFSGTPRRRCRSLKAGVRPRSRHQRRPPSSTGHCRNRRSGECSGAGVDELLNQRWLAVSTFTTSTPRQPNNKTPPPAIGTLGITDTTKAESRTTPRIASAREPSSMNSPVSSRKTATSIFMALPPDSGRDAPGQRPQVQRPGRARQRRRSRDPRPAKQIGRAHV